MKKIIFCGLSLLASTNIFAAVNLGVKANSVNVFTGQRFGAVGEYQIQIQNTTGTKQKYHIRAQLCPEKNKCEVQERNINVLPNDTFNDKFNLSTTVFYNNPGVYKNYVGLFVTEAETKQATAEGVFMVYQRN